MPTTESSVAIFSYIGQDVRTVLIDGQPWFVVRDVAAVLGIQNPRQVVSGFDQDDVSATYIEDSLGRPQTTAIVNEAALYELVFQSRKPEAKQFRRWVTGVVLPEIRQKGVYSLIPTKPVTPELPADYLSALKALVAEVEQTTELRAELAEVMPRVEAWNAIVSAEGDYSVGDAAKMLARAGIPTGPTRLFRQLEEIKWTYRGGDGRPRAYADRVDRGYLSEKPSFHHHPGTGERVVDPPQVRVTLKGIDQLRRRLHIGALKAVTA